MKLLTSKKLLALPINHSIPRWQTLLKNILKVSLPAAMELLFITLIGMADTIMVGNYSNASITSEASLASVALSQQPIFITIAIASALGVGLTSIISRRKGENRSDEARLYLRQSIMVGFLIGLGMTLFAVFFARPILQFAGAKDDTIDNAVLYFRIVSSIISLNYVRYTISSAQRAIGKTNITLIMNIVANLVNIFFNYVLIYGNLSFPELGIGGAAIATVIGNSVAFIIAFISIFNKKSFIYIRFRDRWRLDPATIQYMFKVSTPAIIEQIFMRIGFFIISKIVNDLGTEQTAINAIIISVVSTSFSVTDGFAIGASSLVGRSLGEKDPAKAFAYGRMSQILSVGLAGGLMIVVISTRNILPTFFSTNESIYGEASRLLTYTSLVMLPQSIQWVTTGILRGAGDIKYTARNSIISVTLVRPFFAYILCYPLGLGILGSWIGMFIDQSLRTVLNNTRFIHLKWMKIQI
ncbi:MAG: MATE family efflux transporter [Bacilli bacterium]